MDKQQCVNRIIECFPELKETALEYASEFTRIYNSANHLFPEEKRYPVTEEVFEKQLNKDVNYLYQKEGKNVAFFSYHEQETYIELTSLYVDYEHQRNGIGEEMLCMFEAMFPTGTVLVTKALKDSPWALQFYIKHGYHEADDTVLHMMQYQEKPWEKVLYKVTK